MKCFAVNVESDTNKLVIRISTPEDQTSEEQVIEITVEQADLFVEWIQQARQELIDMIPDDPSNP